jgi:adenylate cyclase
VCSSTYRGRRAARGARVRAGASSRARQDDCGRARGRQRSELARFVSPQVSELLSSTSGEQLLAGHRAYITCLFCDLRNFTGFAETAAPEDLLDVLREYHTALGRLIPAHQGTLEHFAGDGLMIFFNDPVPVREHELQAVRFALAAQERFRGLADAWRKRGDQLALGIGIEAGYATQDESASRAATTTAQSARSRTSRLA